MLSHGLRQESQIAPAADITEMFRVRCYMSQQTSGCQIQGQYSHFVDMLPFWFCVETVTVQPVSKGWLLYTTNLQQQIGFEGNVMPTELCLTNEEMLLINVHSKLQTCWKWMKNWLLTAYFSCFPPKQAICNTLGTRGYCSFIQFF